MNWKVSYIQNEARYEVREQRDGNKRLRGISDTMRRSSIPLVGVPEGNYKENGIELIFEHTMAENLPKLKEDTYLPI